MAKAVLSDYAQHAAEWDCPSTGVLDIGDPDLDGMVPLGDGPLAAHIARHDPARVLADCEARRQIVEEHCGGKWPHPADPCDAHDASGNTIACDTLRALALPFADHPDYREEWRP